MPRPTENRKKKQVNATISPEAYETMKRLMARGHTQGEMLQLGIQVLAHWRFGEGDVPFTVPVQPTAARDKVTE